MSHERRRNVMSQKQAHGVFRAMAMENGDEVLITQLSHVATQGPEPEHPLFRRTQPQRASVNF